MMKKYLVILLSLFLVACTAAVSDDPQTPNTPAPDQRLENVEYKDLGNGLTLYSNLDVGVSFQYPTEWGKIRTDIEDGDKQACGEIDPICAHFTFIFEDLVVQGGDGNFLGVYSRSFRPIAARNNYFGDASRTLVDETSVLGACDGIPNEYVDSCFVEVTNNGYLMSKAKLNCDPAKDCSNSNPGSAFYYFIKSEDTNLNGLVFATVNIEYPISKTTANQFDQMAKSVRFLGQ